MKQIFPLAADLVIPIDMYSNGVFRADKVGMSYVFDKIDHIKEEVSISLILVDLQTQELVKELTVQTYTAAGTNGRLLNEVEYNAYLDEKTVLEEAIAALDQQITEMVNELAAMPDGPEKQQKQVELNELRDDRQEAQADLQALPVVQPLYEKKNTYQEVVSYIEDGMLNAAGIMWGTQLEFQGRPIGDLIIVPVPG